MTQLTISSSTDVLWIPRSNQQAVANFFNAAQAGLASVAQDATTFPSGSFWITNGHDDPVVAAISASASYLYPTNAVYSDLASCSWAKDVSSSAGVFNVTLYARRNYDDEILPGDIFVIYMDDDHLLTNENRSHGTLVTVGIVDRVSRSTVVNDAGAEVVTINVSGRDLGVVFQETELVYDSTLPDFDQTLFSNAYLRTFADGLHKVTVSPPEMIWLLLNLIYSQNATGSKIVGSQWAFSSTNNVDSTNRVVSLLRMLDVTSFVQAPMYGYLIPDSDNLPISGNVWSLLQSYANRCVNEMFVDVRDAGPGERNLLDVLSAAASQVVQPGDAAKQQAVQRAMRNSGTFAQAGASAMAGLDPSLVELDTPVSNPADIEIDPPDASTNLDVESFNSPVGQDTSTSFDPEVITVQVPSDSQANGTTPVLGLVFRQLPYDRDAFMALPTNDVLAEEVYATDFGRSSHDVANWWRVHFPDSTEVVQESIIGLTVHMESVAIHGIRRMEVETQYQFPSQEDVLAYLQSGRYRLDPVFEFYVNLLSTWYCANDRLLAGVITTRFNPKIRVGTRLRYHASDGRIFSFYVQALSHVFDVSPGGSRSTFTVTRGFDESGSRLENNLVYAPGATPNGISSGFATFVTASGLRAH